MGAVVITNFQREKTAWEIVEKIITYGGKSAVGAILLDLITRNYASRRDYLHFRGFSRVVKKIKKDYTSLSIRRQL